MRRLFLICVMLLTFVSHYAASASAPDHVTIYQGPTRIESWDVITIGAIEFQKLELGDTVYVFTKELGDNASAAFQNHEWKSVDEGVINGQIITGDFEMIVNNEKRLTELKNYGLKFTGCRMTVERVVIKKHNDDGIDIVIVVNVMVLVLLLLSSSSLLYNYLKLRKANHKLYVQIVEGLRQNEREKGMRSMYEGQIMALKEIILNNEDMQKKYRNSRLDEDTKTTMVQEILAVMEDVSRISRPDMSLHVLSELIGSNYKDVSQVVNEKFGCNFNVLLNKYRISEACRRLADSKQYGGFTMEAVGESVGFKSRSTFITTFKKTTGLTPSEFLSSVRRENK